MTCHGAVHGVGLSLAPGHTASAGQSSGPHDEHCTMKSSLVDAYSLHDSIVATNWRVRDAMKLWHFRQNRNQNGRVHL